LFLTSNFFTHHDLFHFRFTPDSFEQDSVADSTPVVTIAEINFLELNLDKFHHFSLLLELTRMPTAVPVAQCRPNRNRRHKHSNSIGIAPASRGSETTNICEPTDLQKECLEWQGGRAIQSWRPYGRLRAEARDVPIGHLRHHRFCQQPLYFWRYRRVSSRNPSSQRAAGADFVTPRRAAGGRSSWSCAPPRPSATLSTWAS
jgi:hypothetical protein